MSIEQERWEKQSIFFFGLLDLGATISDLLLKKVIESKLPTSRKIEIFEKFFEKGLTKEKLLTIVSKLSYTGIQCLIDCALEVSVLNNHGTRPLIQSIVEAFQLLIKSIADSTVRILDGKTVYDVLVDEAADAIKFFNMIKKSEIYEENNLEYEKNFV